jgi:hypothetical protein
MSSIARKMKREQAKNQYKRFSRAWRMEKTYQQQMLAENSGTVTEKKLETGDVQKILQVRGEDPMPLLGRRPTFAAWKVAIDNQKAAVEAEKDSQTKVEVKDTEWEETTA